MRNLVHLGTSALVLLALLFAGSLLLWVGIPVGWLWIGSQIQAATDSLGAAVGAMMIGVVVSVAVAVPLLSWLSNTHRALRVARGREDTGHFALEVVLVTSAGVAVTGFVAWFLLFAGASPVPLNIGV